MFILCIHQTSVRQFGGIHTCRVNDIMSVHSDLMASFVLQIQEKDFAVKLLLSLAILY